MMDAEFKKRVMVALYAIAKRCNYEINEFDLDVYLSELAPFGVERVLQAMREIYLDMRGGGRGMPSVNDLKEKMGVKEMSVDLIANDAASRACGAVSLIGYALGPDKLKEAQDYIGPVGWEALRQRFGGWNAFCEQLTFENQMGLQAQLRETARVVAEKIKRGAPLEHAALPEASDKGNQILAKALRIASTGSE